ncbi:hypothetical protein GCM10027039_28990 [Terrabacter koreensis]
MTVAGTRAPVLPSRIPTVDALTEAGATSRAKVTVGAAVTADPPKSAGVALRTHNAGWMAGVSAVALWSTATPVLVMRAASTRPSPSRSPVDSSPCLAGQIEAPKK